MVNVAPTSRWVYAYVAVTIIGWLAFFSVAGAYCPTIPTLGSLRVHIAPSAVCQMKSIGLFWMLLCALSIAGIPLVKQLGWRGRTFYVVAVLLPMLLVAWRNVI